MLTELITAIAVIVLLPIVFGALFCARMREERKMRTDGYLRIKVPKAVVVFFVLFSAFIFFGMIGVLIGYVLDESMPLSAFLIIEGLMLFLFAIGASGFYAALSYSVFVFEDRIVVKKPFCKEKTFPFENIAYYSAYGNFFGGVICYDECGIVVFSVSMLEVGVDAFARILAQRGISLIGFPFPKEKFLQFPRYRLFRKKQDAKAIFFTVLFVGIVFLLMGVLVMSLLTVKEYSEESAEGYVETYEVKEDNFTITLQGDDSVYWLNNIVYDALDKSFLKELKQGIFVRLQIGYTDERGRKNITGIEYFEKTYLEPQAAVAAEYSNYQTGRTIMFVFCGLGGALILFSVPLGVRFKKYSAAYRTAGNESYSG